MSLLIIAALRFILYILGIRKEIRVTLFSVDGWNHLNSLFQQLFLYFFMWFVMFTDFVTIELTCELIVLLLCVSLITDLFDLFLIGLFQLL